MFEITLSIKADAQNYFCDIYKRLYGEVKKDSGILIKQNYRGRCFLAFALREDKKEYYKAKILDEVVMIVIDYYKYEYFKECLMTGVNDFLTYPFLKAISVFDAEFDKEIIKKDIEFSGEILIDSLYHFKLQPLKNRWRKTVEIINQNHILSSKNSMIEVIKYLTEVSDSLVMQTEIQICPKQIKMKNFCSSKCFKRDFEGSSRFLTEIIKLNPHKINLKCHSTIDDNDEIYFTLTKIFDDKIYVLS